MSIHKINQLSTKIKNIKNNLSNEEATKTALVLPFLSQILGFDVFDPTEVQPEFTADVGVKKGEKVDYALFKDGELQIIIECKKYGESLNLKNSNQLYRYFSVTNARIAILTDGAKYYFFSDLDEPNKMDKTPFLEIDLENFDENLLDELQKIHKDNFNLKNIISTANDLKYIQQIKSLLINEFENPSDDFIKFIANRVYPGTITQRVRDQFSQLFMKASSQIIQDQVNKRLRNALFVNNDSIPEPSQELVVETKPQNITPMSFGIKPTSFGVKMTDVDNNPSDSKIVTTQEEMNGFYIVTSILRNSVNTERIFFRDTESYFGIIFDDNNRKPICRLHFNREKKYIELFDKDKNSTKYVITNLNDIYNYATSLENITQYYLNN